MGLGDLVRKVWKGEESSGDGMNVCDVVGFGQQWDDKVVGAVVGPVLKRRGVGLN